MAETQIVPSDPRTWFLASAAQKGQRITITAQGPDHVMALSGLPPRRFHTDPAAHIAANAAVSAYYGLDEPFLAEDIYDIEAEALGQKLVYGESMPTIDFRTPLIAEKSDLAGLKAPADWLPLGRVRYMFEIQKASVGLGSAAAFYCAPFSLAVGIRSYPKLIRDIRRDPAFAHDLFDCLVDQILPSYVTALAAYSGAKSCVGPDAWAAYPDLSPELMEEWVLPYNARLAANCAKRGVIAMTSGVGDYCEEDMGKFDKQLLFQCLDIQVANNGGLPALFLGMGRWQDYPLETVVEYLQRFKMRGQQADISAGVNARFLRDASPEQIAALVRRMIDAMGRDHVLGVWLSSTPADTPVSHVHAAVAAVHVYGQLSVADDLDNVKFQLPQRESFQEYVARMSNGLGLQF